MMMNKAAFDPAGFAKMMTEFKLPDMTKMMQNYKFPAFDMSEMMKPFQMMSIPGMDVSEWVSMQQKNVDALTKANQVLLDGTQQVMEKQMQIMQKAVDEATKAAQDLLEEKDASAQASKRFDLAKDAFTQAVGSLDEVSDIATKSNREAMELIKSRALDAFDELKTIVEKTAQQQAKQS